MIGRPTTAPPIESRTLNLTFEAIIRRRAWHRRVQIKAGDRRLADLRAALEDEAARRRDRAMAAYAAQFAPDLRLSSPSTLTREQE